MPKDRDYAPQRGGGRQTSSRGLPGWLWLLVGIAVGFVAAAGWYVTRPNASAEVAEAGDPPAKAGSGRKKIVIPPKEKPRFEFYGLLPEYEVVVPRESLREGQKPPAPKTADAKPPGRYLIQVGSFRERPEAEQLRAQLSLLDVQSRVEKVTVDNGSAAGQTWYRVRIGPETDQRRVDAVMARLEENEIKALVMMVP